MELVAFLIGGLLVLAGGYLGAIYTLRRLSEALERQGEQREEEKRRLVVASLLGELQDNLSAARGEFRTELRNEPIIPVELATGVWETHRGDISTLGGAYEALRRAYGSSAYANSVRDYILFSSGRPFGKSQVSDYVELHKDILSQTTIPALHRAVESLEALQ